VTLNFKVTVSAQVALGETVNANVTLPDGTTDVVHLITDATGLATGSKQYAQDGTFTCKYTIDQDSKYKATESIVYTATSLISRTLTGSLTTS
jgi:hypothetical protein